MSTADASKTILIVEDDPPLRQLVRRVLAQQGYVLLEARNAEEALHLVTERHQPIDLLITDVVLPHMDGFALSDRVKAICPQAKVLFVSGYAGDSVAVRGGLKESGEQFLLKPFTQDQLTVKVQALLKD
jgi:CheY-like chemotaxis protein